MQIVTTHKNTDFDAFASLIAATLIYPGSIPVLPKQVNPNIKAFLAIHKDLFDVKTVDAIDLDKVRSLIVVDTNSWHRLDGMETLKQKKDLEIILWDHHLNPGDIAATHITQEPMGANITLMVRQLKAERKILTPIHSTLFLAGIYEDTGNLMFPSTKAEDAAAAAFLLNFKADLNVLGSMLRPAYGERQKNVLFEMLQTAERVRVNGYNISINKLTVEGHVGNLSVVVNMYREIINVDAAFGIFANTERNRCIVIGRSNIDGLDIGSIMKHMGGGGHPGAGSAMMKTVQPDVIEKLIIDLIKGEQRSSVRVSDLMSFPVFTVSSDISLQQVAHILREKGCTGIPVLEKEKLVGIISRRDFRKLKRESQMELSVKAFMSRNVITISPEKSPMQAARLIVKHDVGRLPVVEDGRLIGIVTRSDTMLYFYDLLPD
jgi:tRNA nucleotidyltransferase (CCA-adding enzyme)